MKTLFEFYRPKECVRDIYAIDLNALKEKGIDCLLFDLDNTLLPWNDLSVPAVLSEWFSRVHQMGFQTALISNNHPPRIQPVADILERVYVPDAGKPSAKAAEKGIAMLDTSREKAAMIGDQLITDIWTGNRAGVYTILVNPLTPVEFGGTKINRVLEKILMRILKLNRPS